MACGKKGPPLPPLVKLPVAPDNFTAVRRGDTVALDFTVPSTNTDKTRPANVQRVEVYAFTGPTPPTDAELLKRAAKVASVVVKAPRDPNQTTSPISRRRKPNRSSRLKARASIRDPPCTSRTALMHRRSCRRRPIRIRPGSPSRGQLARP